MIVYIYIYIYLCVCVLQFQGPSTSEISQDFRSPDSTADRGIPRLAVEVPFPSHCCKASVMTSSCVPAIASENLPPGIPSLVSLWISLSMGVWQLSTVCAHWRIRVTRCYCYTPPPRSCSHARGSADLSSVDVWTPQPPRFPFAQGTSPENRPGRKKTYKNEPLLLNPWGGEKHGETSAIPRIWNRNHMKSLAPNLMGLRAWPSRVDSKSASFRCSSKCNHRLCYLRSMKLGMGKVAIEQKMDGL